jgi:hypothetical protein
MSDIKIIRFIQINIHLLTARVALGGHDVLDVIEEGIEAFVDNQARFLLGILQLFILILPCSLADMFSRLFGAYVPPRRLIDPP